MKKIYEDSTNYTGVVVKIKTLEDVKGLDNLKKVTFFGNDCLVSKDTNKDELYIFIPAGSIINSSLLEEANLYRHSELNANPEVKGYMEDNGVVRALKFKGVISTGLIIPISILSLIGINPKKLQEGDEFNELSGIEICKKYIKPRKVSGKNSGNNKPKKKRESRILSNQFRFHSDTSHLAKNLHVLNKEDHIVITRKYHGTSAVFANVLVKRELSWFERLLDLFGIPIIKHIYDNIYASRKVIKNEFKTNDLTKTGFYTENIWQFVNMELTDKIESGITIYGEIVGYLQNGKSIQKGYPYGCKVSQHKLLVYRITYTKPDGNTIEFSWLQLKEYCKKYDLSYVKEYYYGTIENYRNLQLEQDTSKEWQEDFFFYLSQEYLEHDAVDCNNNPDEGICLRIDGKNTPSIFKLKSKKFILEESKDDSEEINIEDEDSSPL